MLVIGKIGTCVKFIAFSSALLAGSGATQMALAASSGSGGANGPLSVPYIAGRLGPVTVPSSAPAGGIVPDDFCLPGKFEDCGDHLRDAAEFSTVPQAQVQDGPIFIGSDNPAFVLAPTKIWAQGQFRQISLNSSAEEVDKRSIAIGGDHRFGDSFILGVMVIQNDLTTTFNTTGIEDAEDGTQVGPYIALKLSNIWALDARYVFGSSHHTVTTGGIFTGEYDSDGGFAAVRVSGTFDRGNWRIHPSLEYATVFQDSDAYIDGLRGPIAASSDSDSFVTAALLGYFNSLGNGNLVPYAGIEISHPTGGSGDLFGVVRGGMAWKMNNGGDFNVDFAHGAIGLTGVEDQQMSVRLEIPL